MAGRFLKEVYLRVLLLLVTALPLEWWLTSLMGEGTWAFLASCAVSVLLTAALIWMFGISADERKFFCDKMKVLAGRTGR